MNALRLNRTFFSPLSMLVAMMIAGGTSLRSAEHDSTAKPIHLPSDVQSVLNVRCLDCHSGDSAEGNTRFDNLPALDLKARLETLNKAQEQLFFGLMPPTDAEQPTPQQKVTLAAWIREELRRHNASQLDDKLRYPDYGNYVDHEQLFSGEITSRPFTPARRWLVSPQIFEQRVVDVFRLNEADRDRLLRTGLYGITNPFVLPDRTGVRDYDLESLDGGHLLVMMGNVRWIAEKQIRAARVKNGELQPNEYTNPKDRWAPGTTPVAFENIILKKSRPTDDELIDAIQTQFDCVLRRPATDEELSEYLTLTREAINLAGHTDGLKQMLVAVLLESEFLYRLEFGAGEPDQFGRKKLSPREASFAISYALGDRGPDPQLVQAAQEGRLLTRADYQREVERLLADNRYYRGQIDPTLNGKNYRSNETSHPRIVRFFREFFGYPGASKVFKDSPRSGGIYSNPGRGTNGTPGRLILETDRIVTMFVEQDQNVFENLLTSDQFFVYHDKNNGTGRAIIDEWKLIYETFRDTDWQTDPDRVLEENQEFVKTLKRTQLAKSTDSGRHSGTLVRYMQFFEESFGRGHNPFTTPPWAHGYHLHYSPIYNLPPTPGTERYSRQKVSEREDGKEFWDYPPEQPFTLLHRKGILTHPAWLIAHSSNSHTDPIRRGRWIREKLLAGRVPDVPITVDAQVPEDPDKTFRQRVEMVTTAAECWKCHQHMNPLGLAFEMYDDFGRYRREERLEHPDNLIRTGNGKTTFDLYETAPVETDGELSGTGNPQLDGQVEDAIELIDRLAKSDRVRQSMIRHAFRFFLGRNEMLSDSETLINADRAYLESGGSFNAVIVSLLTSDSFMYRKEQKN